MEYEITDRASNLSPLASNKGSATKVRDAAEHFAYKSSPVRRDLGTGLEKAPFLMQFKGGNSIHEGDREKASSILKNLVYMPARDLGKFKYIFSKTLRDKYFQGIDKVRMKELEDEEKLDYGQASRDEVSEVLVKKEQQRIIDIMWKFN